MQACPPYIALVVLCAGCGTTQLAASNRSLLAALQTAVTSKNEAWLDAVAKQVEDQHAKRAMSDAEYKAFDDIIDIAKKGDWDSARDRVFALSEAHRPTAEDVARTRTPKRAEREALASR